LSSEADVTSPHDNLTCTSAIRVHSKPSPIRKGSHLPDATKRLLLNAENLTDSRLTETHFRLQVKQYVDRHFRDSPYFRLSDITSQPSLYRLGQRIVEMRMKSHLSTERQTDKVDRLFEWVLKKLMEDGLIVIADPKDSYLQFAKSESRHLGAKFERHVYTLVTAEYLSKYIREVADPQGYAEGTNSVDHLQSRLRMLDERFRFLSREIVQDAWSLSELQAMAKNDCIVID
jgi:hypothetical protein